MSGFYNDKLVTVTAGNPEKESYLNGEVRGHRGYTFQARVYDVGGEWGIDNGRISKLDMRKDGRVVASYDRGWIKEPSAGDDRRALNAVTKAFSQPVRPSRQPFIREVFDWKRLSTPTRDGATRSQAREERNETKARRSRDYDR